MISATGIGSRMRPLGPSMLPMWMDRYANVNETGARHDAETPAIEVTAARFLRRLSARSRACAARPRPLRRRSPRCRFPRWYLSRSGRANRIESSAANLFRQANGARRAGEFARAKRLYTDLIAAIP